MKKLLFTHVAVLFVVVCFIVAGFVTDAAAEKKAKYKPGFLTIEYKAGKKGQPATGIWHYENRYPETWGPEYENCTNEKSLIHAAANAIEVQGDQVRWMELCRIGNLGGFYCTGFSSFYHDHCTGVFKAHAEIEVNHFDNLQVRFGRWDDDPAVYWEAFDRKNYHNRLVLKGMCLYKHQEIDYCKDCLTVTWRVKPGDCNWDPTKAMSDANCPFEDKGLCLMCIYEP